MRLLISMMPSSFLLMCLLFSASFGRAQKRPTVEPVIFASFDAVSGDPDMIYKDHPDMALAACSGCGEAGQVFQSILNELVNRTTRPR